MTNPLYGMMTTTQRDTLTATGEAIALLPVPGCQALSTQLTCLAQTRHPTIAQLESAANLAMIVQRALSVDASPDRWLDEVSSLSPDVQSDLIADLIAQRQAQAEQVAVTHGLLRAAIRRQAITTA